MTDAGISILTVCDTTPRLDAALRWSVRALVAIVWISAGAFALSIIAYYLGAITSGTMTDWNDSLPRLYVSGSDTANIGIGVHFAMGAILLLLGPIQLMASVRSRWPTFHRWTGRVYIGAAMLTGVGGIGYILIRGTAGGTPMSVGFLLYGMLLTIAAAQTFRFAMRRDLVRHRAWAIRLFALAIGSWLYRIDYTLWGLTLGKLGRTKTFDGWLDVIMAFWFYIPNLLVAEIFIRGRTPIAARSAKLVALGTIGIADLLLLTASGLVVTFAWIPSVLWRLGVIE